MTLKARRSLIAVNPLGVSRVLGPHQHDTIVVDADFDPTRLQITLELSKLANAEMLAGRFERRFFQASLHSCRASLMKCLVHCVPFEMPRILDFQSVYGKTAPVAHFLRYR
jgi:hypothetical protein